MTLYTDIDPFVCAWVEELIKAGQVSKGDVLCKSIKDIKGDELRPYTRVHLFCGIAGWDYALRLAGWPDDRPVWTGSCPCQPWSDANVAAEGAADDRHLWPDMCRLIGEFGPSEVFGEQVVGAVRRGWWDEVAGDLEALGYACGSAVVPARAIGARHLRKRLFWCANSERSRRERHQPRPSVPCTATTTHAESCDTLARAWSAVDGHIDDLLHCDGVSVAMERIAVQAYGNAIVPQVAAEFIAAYMEAEQLMHGRNIG